MELLWAIADDLTSATEVVAPFAARGFDAGVVLRLATSFPKAIAALSLVTDSRGLPEAMAVKRTREAGARYNGAPILFKTIDSTLRGHVAAEYGSLRSLGHRKATIVAPAFPEAGRTTRDGIQFVHGRPVAESEFARDPVCPARQSSLIELFAGVGQMVVRLPAPLGKHRAALENHVRNGALIIADAWTDEHLDELATSVAFDQVLWVGSPGLARSLARAQRAEPVVQYTPRRQAERLLVLVGSLHPIRTAQLEDLEQGGALVLELDPRFGIAHETERLLRASRQAYDQGQETVVVASPALKQAHDAAIIYSVALGEIGAILIHERLVDALVVTGGDAAAGLTNALATSFLSVRGEIEAGIPIASLSADGDLPFITKAGGFGDARTLSEACEMLRRRSTAPVQAG